MVKTLLSLFMISFLTEVIAQPCIPNTNSLNFGGSAYVNVPGNTNLNMSNAITVEAWIYPTTWAFNSANGSIVCHHSWTSGTEQGFVLRAGGTGQLSFNVAGDSAGIAVSWKEVLSANNTLSLNTWAHVAGSFDGNMLRLYVNGISVGSTAFTGAFFPGTAFPMAIGRLSDGGIGASRYWTGRIDEVRIWNRALSAPELQSNMNTHIDPLAQTGLVGYWRFNEGTGTTVNDISGSGNNGTISSTTFVVPVPFNQTAATPVIIPNGNTLTSTVATSYQWNLNGNPISGATNQVWQAVQNGTYTVTVTDSLGCYATSGPYFIATIGVTELSDGSVLDVRQSNEALQISLLNSSGINAIRIFDMNGKLVLNSRYNNQNNIELTKENMPTGIYILEVSTQKSSGRTRLLIQ